MLHSDLLGRDIAFTTRISNKVFSPISYVDASKLEAALADDAKAVAHAALASFFEGVSGVNCGRFTWSSVKLYYSAFYSCRALLMNRALSVFYVGRSPHSLIAKPGRTVQLNSGNTHSVVLNEFRTRFSADPLLSQSIQDSDPLSWLENLRNWASYRAAPFNDPDPPKHFSRPFQKLRNHLQSYVGEDQEYHSFDPDHAMICYPLWLLERISQDLSLVGKDKIKVSNHYIKIISDCGCFFPEIKLALNSFDFG